MKIVYCIVGMLAVIPIAAIAQTQQSTLVQAEDLPRATRFEGVKIGSESDYRWSNVDYALPRIASSIDRKKGDLGYRSHVGYDVLIGPALIVGPEAGIGRGGATVSATSALANYTLKPGWSWDVSGRAGVLATPSVLLYGRAGYSWLRVQEKTNFRAVTSKDLETWSTRKGFLFGSGIEMAVAPRVFARAEYNRVKYGDGLTTSKALIGVSTGF